MRASLGSPPLLSPSLSDEENRCWQFQGFTCWLEQLGLDWLNLNYPSHGKHCWRTISLKDKLCSFSPYWIILMPFVNIDYAAVPICEHSADVQKENPLSYGTYFRIDGYTCIASYPIKTKEREIWYIRYYHTTKDPVLVTATFMHSFSEVITSLHV